MVGGFNNFILTYGWGDIDLYERFRSAGFCLIDAPAGILNSISHGSDKRFGQQFSANYLQDVSPVNGVCSLPLRELSNFFNRYVAYLTRSVELPDGFIFSYGRRNWRL